MFAAAALTASTVQSTTVRDAQYIRQQSCAVADKLPDAAVNFDTECAGGRYLFHLILLISDGQLTKNS